MLTDKKTQREKIKRRLWEWGTALADCERRREEIKDLQQQMVDADNVLRGQSLDSMPKGTDVGDPTGKALLVKEQTARRIAQLLEEISTIMQRKEKMDREIGALPEKYQTFVDLRYKKNRSLSVEIPRLMHISERTASYWQDDIFERLHDIAEN